MRKPILILVMLLMAATSYNQTSRRSSSSSNNTTERSSRTSSSPAQTTSTRSHSNVNSTNSNTSRTRSSQPSTSTRSSTTSPQHRQTQRTSTQSESYRRSANVNSRSVNSSANRSVRVSYPSSRSYRGHHETTYVYHRAPETKSYRSVHYAYRAPRHVNVIWTRDMHSHYIKMYPEVRHWNYNFGYRINSISAYNADRYIGEVMNVYGKITEVYYSRETDEYFLYMGLYYPYQDFTAVVPGYIARRHSRRPEYYFNNQYINVTGLITSFDGKPETVIKEDFQLSVY